MVRGGREEAAHGVPISRSPIYLKLAVCWRPALCGALTPLLMEANRGARFVHKTAPGGHLAPPVFYGIAISLIQ